MPQFNTPTQVSSQRLSVAGHAVHIHDQHSSLTSAHLAVVQSPLNGCTDEPPTRASGSAAAVRRFVAATRARVERYECGHRERDGRTNSAQRKLCHRATLVL
jgi:hypothetical protein